MYWAAQLIGGLVGGLVLWATFKLSDKALPPGFASNGYGAHSPGLFKLGSVILIEIVMTALLVVAVLSTTHSKFPVGFAGLAIGGALWLIHLISIPISNTSVNPARSLGVALYASESWPKTQLWAFFVFPLIGGAVGALRVAGHRQRGSAGDRAGTRRPSSRPEVVPGGVRREELTARSSSVVGVPADPSPAPSSARRSNRPPTR